MSGGGGSTNTIQSATPWEGVQPGLMALYGQAGQQFSGGGPQTQVASVAPLNPVQQGALANMTDIATGKGFGFLNPGQAQALSQTQALSAGTAPGEQAQEGILNGTNPAASYLQSTLNPNFTNVQNNPALNDAMNAANYNTNYNFTRDVMPGIASQFSAAGRFGSNAQTDAIGQATNNLASQISNTNAGMSLADLQQLQGIQSNNAGLLGGMDLNASKSLNDTMGTATQLLPSMSALGMGNAQSLLGTGTAYQTQQQNILNQIAQQYNLNQMQPWNAMNLYAQLLAGGNPYATQSSSGSNQNMMNPFTTAMGAGLLGNSLYSSGALSGMGSLFAGAGSGAAAGGATAAGLAALGSTGAEAAGGGMTALMGLGGMMAM